MSARPLGEKVRRERVALVRDQKDEEDLDMTSVSLITRLSRQYL